METKVCKECKEEKIILEFQQGRAKCKSCVHKRQKQWYNKHKKEILMQKKIYRASNTEKIKEWKEKHKEQINETRRKYEKERLKNDSIYKLKHQLRKVITRSFERKKWHKQQTTETILGCDINTFINHLLQTYKNNYGMEWDGEEKVHIDHKIPLAIAKTEEEVMQLCNYKNLQLLKEKDNLEKGAKLNYELKGE